VEESRSGDSIPLSGWAPPGDPPAAAQRSQSAGSPGEQGWGQGGGQGPWPGPPDPWLRPPRTEPTAIWALVVAVLSFFLPVVLLALVALVLAVIAGRRIRRSDGALRGWGMAVTAMVVGVIGLLFNLAFVGLLVAGGFEVSWNIGGGEPSAAPTATTLPNGSATATTLAPGTAPATTLVLGAPDAAPQTTVAPGATTPAGGSTSALSPQVGQCIRDPVPDQVTALTTIEVVDCAVPHAAEVIANVAVPGSTFPGDQQLDATAETSCKSEFQLFVGIPYDSSVLNMNYVAPTEEGWANGDHAIDCYLVTGDGSPLTGSMRGAAR
jgi:hypothetical protein